MWLGLGGAAAAAALRRFRSRNDPGPGTFEVHLQRSILRIDACCMLERRSRRPKSACFSPLAQWQLFCCVLCQLKPVCHVDNLRALDRSNSQLTAQRTAFRSTYRARHPH